MKLSERFYNKYLKENLLSCKREFDEIKVYGEICSLEGKKSEAKWTLKGSDKIYRLREINKELRAIAQREGV